MKFIPSFAASLAVVLSATAATQTWVGNSSTYWTNGANWAGAAVPVAGDTIQFTAASTGNLSTVLGTNFSIASLVVGAPTGAVSLVSDGKTNILTVAAAGLDLSAAAQDLTFSMGLALGAGQTWTVATSRTINANGIISGANQLIKAGPGTLILNSSNTFSGGLIVTGGTVRLVGDQQANRLANGSSVTIHTNGVVDYASVNATATAGNAPTYTINPGGTLLLGQATHVHLNNVNMSGGRITSQTVGGGKYNSEDAQLNGTITVTGSQPSTITLEYGLSMSGTPTFNVADVTASAAADLILGGPATGGVIQDKDSGNNGFIKTGAGTMRIDSATTHTGPTTINAGRLTLGAAGTLQATPTITIAAGAVLDASAVSGGYLILTGTVVQGGGSVTGGVSLLGNARILPGGASTVGNLAFGNDLSLVATVTNVFDFGATNDTIIVGGTLIPADAAVAINSLQPIVPGTYTLVRYGAKGGSFNTVVSHTTRFTMSLDETPTDRVDLVVSGGGASLRWNSTNATAWDAVTTTNWYNLGTLADDAFYDGDAVLFDDTPGITTSVALAAARAPALVTVDSSLNSFTFGGAGKITGTTGLNKTGTNVLTLGTGNDFTGPLVVSGGVVRSTVANGFGNPTSVTVLAGAQANFNGNTQTFETAWTIAGSGPDGRGAIVNTNLGIYQRSGVRFVTFAGDTTIGAFGTTASENGRLDIGSTGYVLGNGYTLTKVGANVLVLKGGVTNLQVVVQEGMVGLEQNNGSTITNYIVLPGAYLGVYGGRTFNTPLLLSNAMLATHAGGGSCTWSGPIALGGGGAVGLSPGVYGYGPDNITLNGEISGSGGLAYVGAGTAFVNGTNTYSGLTTITGGTAYIRSDSALGAAGGGLRLTGGGTLRATNTFGLADRALTLTGGNGGINVDAASTLVISNTITAAGDLYRSGVGVLALDGSFVSTVATNARSFDAINNAITVISNNANLSLNGVFALGSGANQGGSVVQMGGSVFVGGMDGNRAFMVGEYPGETSVYTMVAGSLTVPNGPTFVPWNATVGTWNQSGGTATLRQVVISTGIGTLNLNGGTFSIGAGGIIRPTGTSIVNLNGTRIAAYTNWASALNMNVTNALFDTGPWTISLTGVLSGPGALSKSGTGVLWFGAAQTYTGATAVGEGTLASASSLASPVVVSNAASLAVGTATSLVGSLTLPAVTLSAGASLQLPFNTTAATLRVTGTNALTTSASIPLSVGGVNAVGTYPLIDYTGTVQGAGVSAFAIQPFSARGGSASLVDNPTNTTIDLVIAALGDPLRWLGNVSSNWDINTTTNWQLAYVGSPAAFLQSPLTDSVLFDDGATLFGVNIATNVAPLATTFSNAANDYTINGAPIGGTAGISKYNAAKVTLNATNTFGGPVVVYGGTVAVPFDGALGAIPAAASNQVILAAGGRLEASGSFTVSANRRVALGLSGAPGTATIDTGSNTLTITQPIVNNTGSTGTLVKTGSGSLVLQAYSTFSGGTVVSNGTLVAGIGDSNLGVVRGALTVRPGATLLSAARDSLGYAGGAPASPINLEGGSLIHTPIGNLTLFGQVVNMTAGYLAATNTTTGSLGIDFGAGGTVNTFASPGTSVLAGVQIRLRQASTTFTVSDGAADIDFLVSAPVVDAIGGSGIAKAGPGTMALTGANSYNLGTAINGGTLEVDLIADGGTSRIGTVSGANNYLGIKGATLRYTGAGTNSTTRYLWVDQGSGTFDIAQPTGALVLSPSGGTRSQAFVKTGPGRLVFNGAISSTSTVTVAAGTLELNGTNTYVGTTTVTGGTLLVNGGNTGTGDVVVTGGTLGGTGTIGGSILSAGMVSPGASIGTLTTAAAYSQATNGVFAIELGGPSIADALYVGGVATLAGTLNITLINGYTGSVGDTFTILNAVGGLTGTFSATNAPALPDGKFFTGYVSGNTFVLAITSAPALSGYNLYAQGITNAAQRGYQDDPDGDGFANLLEYATGGDATNVDTTARMQGGRTNGVLALTFSRNTNAIDATLVVEGSYATTNGADWIGIATNLAGSWGGATNVFETGPGSPVNVRVQDVDSTATNRFLRLRVSGP